MNKYAFCLVITFFVALWVGGLAGYTAKSRPIIQKVDNNSVKTKCTDIVRYRDGRLVCEIDLVAEDSV